LEPFLVAYTIILDARNAKASAGLKKTGKEPGGIPTLALNKLRISARIPQGVAFSKRQHYTLVVQVP
jgi:hypothetical protein